MRITYPPVLGLVSTFNFVRTVAMDPVDFVLSRYAPYTYEATDGRFVFYNWESGILLIPGGDANEIEVSINNLDEKCVGRSFSFLVTMNRRTIKKVELVARPTTTVRFSNPELIMLVYNYYVFVSDVSTVAISKNAITVKLLSNNITTATYDIDVVGIAGDVIDWDRGYGKVVFKPTKVGTWHFLEYTSADYGGFESMCLTAYDSEDLYTANVVTGRCEPGLSVALTFPPSTPMVVATSVPAGAVWNYLPHYFYYLVAPYPKIEAYYDKNLTCH
ncbi:MAG: hypothetical protein QXT86_09995 [Archaeoglobaceae archaeon]